jgi:ComF family protein
MLVYEPPFGAFLLDTLYPHLCGACGNMITLKQSGLCVPCEFELPVTNYYEMPKNPVEKIFWGRLKLERAASFLIFNKLGMTQKLIHELKYNNNQELGVFLGKKMGATLLNSAFVQGVDAIIPMPLHPQKQAIRGYNQCELIATGLSEILGIPSLSKDVIRKKNTKTQTLLSRTARWSNVDGIFNVTAPESLNDKHLLLLDDTVTTGATIESLGRCILNKTNCKLSVLTLGSIV